MFNNIKLNDILVTFIIIFIFYKIWNTLYSVIKSKTKKIHKNNSENFYGTINWKHRKKVKKPSYASNVKYVGINRK